MIANFGALAREEPIYLVAMALLLVLGALLARDPSVETRRHRVRVNTALAILFFGLLMAVKYGVSRYLVPELAFLGPLLLIETLCWGEVAHTLPAPGPRWRWGGALLALALGIQGLSRLAVDLRQEIRLHQSTLALDARLGSEYPMCTIVPFYGASDQHYGLLLANAYTGGHFGAVLTGLYPDVLSYHVWGARFEDFLRVKPYEEMRARLDRGDCILLRGMHPFDALDSEHYNPRLALERLVVGDAELIYRVVAISP
jgi:hypothetical protein